PMPPHLRFVPGEARRVVAGEGHVERVEVVNADSDPLSVNVENLDEASGPLGEIARIMQQGLRHLAEEKQEKEPPQEDGGRRGPSPLPFKAALRYVKLLRKWADVQEENEGKTRRERTSKLQFARANNTTEPKVKAAQSWYNRQRAVHGFPADPRQLSDEELRRHFPRRT
ncbi:MAG: hypothetical protein KAX19_01140, partial [Candidatus Brocadiae bacterium]|nr:hypothetical protein [Candidatus Brocadiia bacterium]